jgi:uncharacterized membrane protein
MEDFTTIPPKKYGELELCPDIENMMLDTAWKQYHLCFENKREAENKANILLASIGVLLGLIFNGLNLLNVYIALIGCLILIISAICCVLSLRLRTYEEVNTMNIWNAFVKNNYWNNPNSAKHSFFQSIAKKNKNNLNNYNNIVFWLKIAIPIFTIGFITVFLSLLVEQLLNCN